MNQSLTGNKIKSAAILLFSLFISALFFAPPANATLPLADSQGQRLPSLAPMLERATPAVVNIATTGHVRVRGNPLLDDPFFREFFNVPQQPRTRKTNSLGSGVIVDSKNGYILTNNHVIDKADEITVTLRSGESHVAKLIGTDPESDVAVIQIEAKDLQAIPLGDSEKLHVGDFAVAIGNPFGLGQTVTSGIISALDRSGLGIQGYEDFIQTDASINPGNSGGALVNLRGELIGINNAIFSRSGGNIGIGFAIPINMAREIMQQLVSHGEVKRGRLGAQAQDLTPELAQAFSLKQGRGAVITQVESGSAAYHAGLKVGDIIIEINGKPVRDSNTVRNSIGLLRVGEKVTLKVLREGKSKMLTAQVSEPTQSVKKGEQLHAHLTGAVLSDIEEDSRLHGRIEGVLVKHVEPGSPGWRAGLRQGDVITSVNKMAIKNLKDFRKVIKRSNTLLLNIRRGNAALFLYFK